MEKIVQHIEYLIRRHDCVVLPAIGAFLVSHRDACVNEQWGVVQPSCREICFNSAIRHSDGLLASSVSRREGISFEAAARNVEQVSFQMREKLSADGELRIGHIGVLNMDAEGRLVFHHLADASALAERIGLPPVALPRRRQEAMEEQVMPRSDERYDKGSVDRKKFYMLPKLAVRVAVSVILVALGAISFLLPDYGDGGVRNDYASMIPMEKISSATGRRGENQMIVPVGSSSEGNLADEVSVSRNKSYLIVSSMPDEAQALLFINMHTGSGYNLRTMQGGTYCHVVAMEGEDPSQLLPELRKQDFKKKFPDAWILSVN